MRRVASLAIVVGLAVAITLHAQAPDQKPLAFEVASVKATPPERQNQLRPDFCQAGGRFSVASVPLLWSVTYAYRVKNYQIIGSPAWMNQFDSAYDIEAKPSEPVNEAQCRLMVQSLLTARFKMTTHRESRESSVYLLTVGKNGPKLREGGGVRLNGGVQVASGKPSWPNGLTMPELAGILSNYTDRPVVDRTRLAGRYGITLNFSLQDGDGGVSIFTAVQEQLGLKLESTKGPVDVLVIDHIERPTPD